MKNMFLVFSILVIFFVRNAFSTVKRYTFVETLGKNSSAQDWGCSLTHDPKDDTFVVAVHNVDEGGNTPEAILVKYDADGFILWANILRGIHPPLYESCSNGVEVADDGYVITGWSIMDEAKREGLLLAKFDSEGSMEWVKNGALPNNEQEVGNDIKRIENGYIIAGDVYGRGGGNDLELMLANVDSSGGLNWIKTLGGSGSESGLSIDVLSNGTYVVCGSTFLAESMPLYDKRILVAKYDTAGILTWAKAIYLENIDLHCSSIKSTTDGGFVVVGEVFWNKGGWTDDAVILKLDGEGSVTWSYSIETSGDSRAKDVLELQDGSGYIITGHTQAEADEPTYPLIAKISINGETLLWTKFLNVSSSTGPSHFPDYREGHAWDVLELDNSEGTLAVSGFMGAYGVDHMDVFLSVLEEEQYGCDWEIWNETVYVDIQPDIGVYDCTSIAIRNDITSEFSLTEHTSNFTVEPMLRESHSLTICEVCNENYYGVNCSITQCFDIWNNDTSSSDIICSGHGSCQAYNTCVCHGMYHGEQCDLIVTCYGIHYNLSSEVCSGHGSCIDLDTCQCFDNYYGPFCNVTTCNGVLNNETINNNTITPDTDPIYSCTGHGTCEVYDHCVCDPQYYGISCNISTCYGVLSNSTDEVCSGQGTCTDLNSCLCESDYFGISCNITTCDGIFGNETDEVCSGHGTCFPFDECTCTDDYQHPHTGGDDGDCSDFQCDGIWKDEEDTVCSEHGSCVAPDTCECDEHYDHVPDCSVWECFGVLSSGSPCSNHGTCDEYNDCDCDNNYFLNDCRGYQCFGMNLNDSNLCNKKGDCVGHDDCDCFEGYESTDESTAAGQCDTYDCYGIVHDDSSVCHGGGICAGPDECACKETYGGDECERCATGWTGEDCLEEEDGGGKNSDNNPIVWLWLGLSGLGIVVIVIGCLVCAILVCLCAACCLILIPSLSWASICSVPSIWIKKNLGIGGGGDDSKGKGRKGKRKKKKDKGFKKLKDEFKAEVVQEMPYDDSDEERMNAPYMKIK